MKIPSRSFRLNRPISFLIFFLLLMLSFFASFYFYYIPSNKESVNKYAFLILNNIKKSIEDRNKDLKEVISTKIRDSIVKNLRPEFENRDPNLITGDLINLNDKNFIYRFSTGKDSISDLFSREHKLFSFFSTYKDELFDGFMLMKNNDSDLVNIRDNLKIDAGNIIRVDSLLKDRKGLFIPGTRTIDIGDIEYNMFYVPFTVDRQNIMILGFLKTSTYDAKIHEIPPTFLYIFVTLFLILLVAMPVLKFFFMSHEEEIRFRDLFLFVFSILTGSTLITLCIIQFMILQSNEIRAENNLNLLSAQIRSSFLQEINKAYRKLSSIDSEICEDSCMVSLPNTNFKKVLVNFDRNDTSQFLNFDRVSWLNDTGMQILKGEIGEFMPFLNLKDRKYYLNFKNEDTYNVPGLKDSVFTIVPIHNRINGEFKTVISKRSLYPGTYIASLSCDLRSVTQTILPAGYKFCIINASGQVQYHSDSTRNLNENFLNNLDDSEPVEKAIHSRQSTVLNNAMLYGKSYCINISPIKDLPLFLVTFYDESHIASANMRILIFALLLCFVSFILYVSVWYFELWKPVQGLLVLQDPIKSSSWIIPKPGIKPIYKSFIIFLSSYAIVLIVLTIRLKTQDISNNYAMLLIMLATPFNLLAGAFIILNKHRKNVKGKDPKTSKKISRMFTLMLTLFLSATVLLLLYEIQFAYFIYFEALLFVLLNFYYYYDTAESDTNNIELNEKRFSTFYSFTSILTIILLAILPACIFTWYSHNQELMQTVKKQQLYLATKLSERKSLLQKTELKKVEYSENYYKQICYRQGVYCIYSDSIEEVKELPSDTINSSFDKFYFDISNNISNAFDKGDIYPALQDLETDSAWRWHVYPTASISFFYNISSKDDRLSKSSTKNNYLRIKSEQPPRFVILSTNKRGFYLFVITVLILVGIYFIIYQMSAKVFLKKFVFAYKGKPNAYIPEIVDKYITTTYGAIAKRTEMIELSDKYRIPFDKKDLASIANAERELISEIEKHELFYKYIWKECKEKEKYLLYNFSRDGMLNFKNTTTIHTLFKKGLLIVNEHYEVCLFAASFRLFILHYLSDEEMLELKEKINQYNTWGSFKTPLLVILISLACFVFLTQEQTWQRVIAFITVFGSSFPLLINLFSSTSSKK